MVRTYSGPVTMEVLPTQDPVWLSVLRTWKAECPGLEQSTSGKLDHTGLSVLPESWTTQV